MLRFMDGRAGPVERLPPRALLHLLYPLEHKLPGLTRVPVPVRRRARRALTAAAVRAGLARCRDTTFVGITGSLGKTTVKDLTAAMLSAAGPTVRTRHNDNDVYGVPVTLLGVRPGDRHAVIELGVHWELGEMRWMSSLFHPRVAVLTGVGEDHLRAYGSREALGREKRALLERVPAGGTVVVPAGDPLARRLAQGLDAEVVLAGREPEADVRLLGAALDWPRGMDVELAAGGERVTVRVALHALHYAEGVALAAAAALACGVDLRTAARGAASFRTPPGRCEAATGPNGSLRLVDDYKSRVPTALAAVRALGDLPAERRVAVLGEVMEREQDEQTYAPIADLLVGRADVVVAVGDCGPPLAALLGGRGPELVRLERVEELARWLERECRPGDVILSHGSATQHLERAALLLEGRAVGCRVRHCVFGWRCGECPWLEPGPPPHRVLVP